jgi:hypothetical protein
VSRERQSEPQSVVAPPSAPKPHERVRSLVAQARNDPDAAKALVDALVAMRAPGDEADEARVLLQHLDAKSLDGLFDETGRNAKREAVKTLLSLGFPHALNVSPEDLAEYRKTKPDELGAEVLRKDRRQLWLLVLVLVAQAPLVALTLPADDRRFTWWALAAMATTVAGAAWGLLQRSQPETSAWPQTLAVLGVLAGTAIAALSGPTGLTAIAILVTVLVVVARADSS